MSWTMYHIEGYGFRTTNLDAQKMYEFMVKHELSICKSDLEWLQITREKVKGGSANTDTEVRERFTYDTFAETISGVINRETKIQFDGVGRDEDGEECVMYVPGFPWNFKGDERKFKSEDDVKRVLAPYMIELGISPTEFGWQDLVFQG